MKRSLLSILFLSTQLFSSEGFIAGTKVLTPRGNAYIEDIKRDDIVISYDTATNTYTTDAVTAYIVTPKCNNLKLMHIGSNAIVTQPHHQFYAPETQEQWQRVNNLTRNSVVLTYAQHKDIQDIIALKDTALPVYTLSIKKHHNFLITDEGILVHNVEPITLTVAAITTSEVVTAVSAGAATGFLAYVGSKLFGKSKNSSHQAFTYHQRIAYEREQQALEASKPARRYPEGYFASDAEEKAYEEKIKKDQALAQAAKDTPHKPNDKGKSPEKEETPAEPDAQAPGKPTEADGFIEPKNSDGKKVRTEKGWGWKDKKGNVWVPSGPNGHGGAHWDVQRPKGGYENVVRGGRVRGSDRLFSPSEVYEESSSISNGIILQKEIPSGITGSFRGIKIPTGVVLHSTPVSSATATFVQPATAFMDHDSNSSCSSSESSSHSIKDDHRENRTHISLHSFASKEASSTITLENGSAITLHREMPTGAKFTTNQGFTVILS